MKHCFWLFLFFAITFHAEAQSGDSLIGVLSVISKQWKADSNSCKGYRKKVSESILKARIGLISSDTLLKVVGKPNHISRFGDGSKQYIAYIYYIFKDECPNYGTDAIAIQFLFYENGTYRIKVSKEYYCS